MMKRSLVLLLTLITTPLAHAQQQGCRTTTSTQSIICSQSSCTPRYEGGCSDDEFQEDSTQTYCNVDGDTTTCGYSVVCCSPNGSGGMMMAAGAQSSTGTCGNGNVGNNICPIEGECCSQFGWCGTTPDHCADNNGSSNNLNNNQASAAAASDWWDNEAVYKKEPTASSSSSTTRYSDTYSSTWNGLPIPSNQQNLRSSPESNTTRSSSPAQNAGASAGLGFAFVVIGIAGCYAWRREQDKADCPGGTDGIHHSVVVPGGGVLDADGGSLARMYGIDSSDDEYDGSDDEIDDVRSRRSRNTGRDPSVYGNDAFAGVVEDGRSKSSSSRRGMGRDPSVKYGGSIRSTKSGSGRRRSVEDDARSQRSSATKSIKRRESGGGRSRDASINNGSATGAGGSNSKKTKNKKSSQYPAPAAAPPRPPPPKVMEILDRKLSNNSRESDSRKQRKEWVKKTIYDTGSEDEDGFDDDTDSQLNWAA